MRNEAIECRDIDSTELMWASLRKLLRPKTPIDSDAALAELIEHRLPVDTVDRLLAYGVAPKEIAEIVIPPRTLSHRRVRKEPLSVEESDRAARLARVLALSESVWRSPERGLAWLRKRLKKFREQRPIDMLKSEAGARVVEEYLIQIDEGFIA